MNGNHSESFSTASKPEEIEPHLAPEQAQFAELLGRLLAEEWQRNQHLSNGQKPKSQCALSDKVRTSTPKNPVRNSLSL